jgi:WD40 repeat protein
MKKLFIIFFSILLLNNPIFAQRLLKTFAGHTNAISSIGFALSGKTVYSGSWDKTVRLWNPMTGETTRIIETGKSIVFSASISKDSKTIAVGNWSQNITIYNTLTGEVVKTFKAHSFKTNYLTYSPDGKTILSVGIDTIKFWDAATYNLKFSVTGHKADISKAVFNANNLTVASASYDGMVNIWDASNGSLIKSFKAHSANIPSLAFSSDGKFLFTLGEEGTVKMWDAGSFALLSTIGNICSGANDMDVSSDGKFVAVAGKDNMVYLVNVWDSKVVSTLKGHTKPVTCVAFSPNGEMLITAGDDTKIMLWELSDLKYYKCLEEKMKVYADQGKPKGEFETSEQYNKRKAEYEKIKAEKKKECAAEDALLKVEQQASVQGNPASTYKWVTLKIANLNPYNADKQTYDLTIEGNLYTLKMPMAEAKSFKNVWQQATVKGIQRANPTTKKAEYINMQVVHPLTNVAYMVGPQVLPSTDKYLKEFLDKNPQQW